MIRKLTSNLNTNLVYLANIGATHLTLSNIINFSYKPFPTYQQKNPTCFHKSDLIYFLKSIFFVLKTTSESLHRKPQPQLP